MKKEYDFSKATRGRFYQAIGNLELPVYLDKKIGKFYAEVAIRRKTELRKVVNIILKKEMKSQEEIGVKK